MSAPALLSISDRMRSWSVTPKKSKRPWYGPKPAPKWYLATSPDGENHEVAVRERRKDDLYCACMYHGKDCESAAIVAGRLLHRAHSLLPSRAEIEEPAPKGKWVEVGYHLTPIGKEVSNEEPDSWCSWCEKALANDDAVIVYGNRVHRGECADESCHDSGEED